MKRPSEIKDYDDGETSGWINPKKKLLCPEIALRLPATPATQLEEEADKFASIYKRDPELTAFTALDGELPIE